MKKYLLLLIILFSPIFVSAKEYNIVDLPTAYNQSNYILLKPGDVITFDGYDLASRYKIHMFLDGEPIDDNCYGFKDGCLPTFTVTTTSYYNWYTYRNEDMTVFYLSTTEDAPRYYLCDLEEGRLYKSGAVVYTDFQCNYFDSHFYDDNDDELSFYGGWNSPIPQLNGKDVLWQLTLLEDSVYESNYHAIFKPYDYQKPQFQLVCENNSIEYGKKTKCSIITTYIHPVNTVSFDLNIPNFKISDVSYPSGISSTNGRKEYNLRVANPGETETTLLNFYLEGTKNENYTDDIQIVNIDYRDNVYEGDYTTVQGDLSIIPSNPITNPKTWSNIFFVLLPIIVLLVILSYEKIIYKKQKEM